MKDTPLVEIGEIIKPHGIKGEIVANIDTDVDINDLEYIITRIDGLEVPFFITSCRPRGAESVLLTLDGVNDERDAAELTHHPILVPRDKVSDQSDDQLTASDLIGYTLVDNSTSSDTKIGVISGIREMTEANWLFEVDNGSERTILIPIADELISDIDTDTKRLTMTLPEGLVEL